MHGSSGDVDIENRLVDTEWEGKAGTNGESSKETFICKIDSQWGFRVLKPIICENLVGWDGMRGGSEFQEGGNIYIPMTDSC